MKKYLCTEVLGTRNVEVYVTDDYGGKLAGAPGTKAACILVGLANKSWPHTLSILMHEAMEFANIELCTRFTVTPDYAMSSDGFVFVQSHQQFSEAVARCAYFMSDVVDKLHASHTKFHRPKSSRRSTTSCSSGRRGKAARTRGKSPGRRD